jgi:hypothetical protein
MAEEINSGNGKSELIDLSSFAHNPYGRIFTLDFETNELIVLSRRGRIVEFMGMPKGGKSKQIRALKEGDEEHPELIGLENDAELTEFLGKQIDIAVFKPNSAMKVLFEKDPKMRAVYNETIIHSHGELLGMLTSYIRGDINIKTREVDLAILDRGPNDDAVWTNALYDFKTTISQEERDYHLSMAQHLEQHLDLAIGMNVLPEVAMEREGGREGKAMNIPFLRKLYEYYGALAEEAIEGEQPITIQTPYLDIDGEGIYVDNAQTIYRRVKRLYIPKDPEELRVDGDLEKRVAKAA